MPKWVRALIVLVLLAVAVGAVEEGLRLRRWAWDETDYVRYTGDIARGFGWGLRAEQAGLFNLYDELAQEQPQLDYTPLRLSVMRSWVMYTRHKFPDAQDWQSDYDFNAYMMNFNSVLELNSAMLVFAIVVLWRRRMSASPGFFTGVGPGFFAFLVFWFSPAVIWDSHCWPQWDVWLMPFFLAAVLLACVDWWFAAGMMIAIGANLKGQMLIAAPIMLLWPVFQLRFGRLLRWAGGFCFMMAAIIFPWLHPPKVGIIWYSLMLAAMALLAPLVLRWKLNRKWLAGLAIAAVLLAWPWKSGATFGWRCLPIAVLALIAASRFLNPRLTPAVYGLMLCAIVMFLMPLFNASTNWYTIGFVYGTQKFEDSMAGNGVFNIPRMMVNYFGTPDNPQQDVYEAPPWMAKIKNRISPPEDPSDTSWQITYEQAAAAAYGVTLILCGIGAAIQDRRRDVRLLAALVAPWLCFFMFLTQMHGRYTVWAAGFSAMLVAIDSGFGILSLILSLGSMAGIMYNQYINQNSRDAWMYDVVSQFNPGLGWMFLCIMLIYLYFAVAPRWRGRKGRLAKMGDDSWQEKPLLESLSLSH